MTYEWPAGLAHCADCCRYALCDVCSRGSVVVGVYPRGVAGVARGGVLFGVRDGA